MAVPGTILQICLDFHIEDSIFFQIVCKNVIAIGGTGKTVPYEKTSKLTDKPKFAALCTTWGCHTSQFPFGVLPLGELCFFVHFFAETP